MNPVHFSSKTDDWATPQDFFDELNTEFGFVLDVCATHENAKCPRWYSLEAGDDGLKQDWAACGGPVWMNPPYGDPEHPCKKRCFKKRCRGRGYHNSAYRPGIKDWVAKARAESEKGATVVCLLPARTDTRWFHDHIEGNPRAAIRFIKGRLKFGGAKNSAPFPSVVVVFRPPGAKQ